MSVQHPDIPVVIRAEEQLHVGTRPTRIGRAVLRRTVVVEERTITVQVRHEEAHLEIVPLDTPLPDDEPRAAHAALPELVLHREEISVVRRLVPVERVRLDIQRVTEHQQVTEQLRQERIDVEDGSTPPGGSAGPDRG